MKSKILDLMENELGLPSCQLCAVVLECGATIFASRKIGI